MCIPVCCCFIEFLPFICLVTVPFYGVFCGVNVILRLSLLLFIHSVIINFIPKQWITIVPYSQILLLVGLAYLPVNITPWPVIWLYKFILILTEPILLWLEVVLVQNCVMRCSQHIVDEWDSNDPKTRALLIAFSSVCYGITASFSWSIYTEGTYIQIWCLLIVGIIFIMIHNMMVISPEGILSDAAFCALCSVSVLYAMVQETSLIQHPTHAPASWNRFENSSFVKIFLSILSLKMEHAFQALELLKLFLTPFFLVTMVIRLYSILFIVDKVSKNILEIDDTFDEQEMDFISEEELFYKLSPWRSTIIVKLSIIFMFTQLSVLFLSEISGQQMLDTRWLHNVYKIWPSQILLGRLSQIIAVNSFYIWRLFRADEWTWSDWL